MGTPSYLELFRATSNFRQDLCTYFPFVSGLGGPTSLTKPKATFWKKLNIVDWGIKLIPHQQQQCKLIAPGIRHLSKWSGGAKVSCILCHRGVQLIMAYSWARPAILVAGKGREVMFLFLLFLHFHSCSSFFPSLSFISSAISSVSVSPFLWETTQNDPQGLTCR